MRLGKLVLIAALGGVLISSTATAGAGKLLEIGRDKGFPYAFARGTAIKPTKILIRITAKPKGPVQVSWDNSCARRAKGKVREGNYTINGRKLKRIKKAFKRPDDCLVNVMAGYEDASTQGTLKIQIFQK